ncbi:MAG: hypothetical protein AAB371_00100 [Patescibacteria group bacterium]
MDPTNFIQQYCAEGSSLQGCIQGVYNMGIALAIAVAFLYIVIGAVEYMTSAAINKKGAGKNKIIGAIIGLLIIFTSGVLLFWINPEIFNAELIIFKVTKLEPPTFDISNMEGNITPIGDSYLQSITGQKNALDNSILNSSVLINLPSQVQEAVSIAHTYANNAQGRQRYKNKYGGTESTLTSCSHFIFRVLMEARAIPNTCSRVVANNYPVMMGNAGWSKYNFDITKLQPGDVLVNIRTGGVGHVAIVVPVITKNKKTGLILANASWHNSLPRLTSVYNDFDFIFRKVSNKNFSDADIDKLLNHLKCKAGVSGTLKYKPFALTQSCISAPKPKYSSVVRAAYNLYLYNEQSGGRFGITYAEIQKSIVGSNQEACNFFALTSAYLTLNSRLTIDDITPRGCVLANYLDNFFKNKEWKIIPISNFKYNIQGIKAGDILQNKRNGVGHVVIVYQIKSTDQNDRKIITIESSLNSHHPKIKERDFNTIIGGDDPFEYVIRLK